MGNGMRVLALTALTALTVPQMQGCAATAEALGDFKKRYLDLTQDSDKNPTGLPGRRNPDIYRGERTREEQQETNTNNDYAPYSTNSNQESYNPYALPPIDTTQPIEDEVDTMTLDIGRGTQVTVRRFSAECERLLAGMEYADYTPEQLQRAGEMCEANK